MNQMYQLYLMNLLILHFQSNLLNQMIQLYLRSLLILHYLLIHVYLKNYHQRQMILQFLMYQTILIPRSQL